MPFKLKARMLNIKQMLKHYRINEVLDYIGINSQIEPLVSQVVVDSDYQTLRGDQDRRQCSKQQCESAVSKLTVAIVCNFRHSGFILVLLANRCKVKGHYHADDEENAEILER